MTKVSLKDMTRELITDADKVLEDSSRVRSQADALTEALRQAEERFLQEDAERSAKARREEQQRIVSSHSKAFTMPDDEVQPAEAPVPAPAAPAATAFAVVVVAALLAALEVSPAAFAIFCVGLVVAVLVGVLTVFSTACNTFSFGESSAV